MKPEVKLPGKALANRPLHFIWLCDCSGSMSANGKIQSLNNAIREVIPHMQKAAEENPNAEVLVRALKFSDGAQWHISTPTNVKDFKWSDLSADGQTDMGAALRKVSEQLKIPPMSDRALPPVLVLISDGQPTDDFVGGMVELEKLPWGKKAVRIAIAIGDDADEDVLQRFIGNSEIRVLTVKNPDQLIERIRWASTVVLKAVSSPDSQPSGAAPTSGSVAVPKPPEDPVISADDVW